MRFPIKERRSRSRAARLLRAMTEKPPIKLNSYKLSELDEVWINHLDKTIDSNDCWIPKRLPNPSGYVYISIEGYSYRLHRLVLCILNKLRYDDDSFETRHDVGCDKACFNPNHIKAGSHAENMRDKALGIRKIGV